MRITDYTIHDLPHKSQLLKLETSDGLVGWGEPVLEGRASTTATAVEELVETHLLGEDPLRIEDHWQTMYRGGFYRGGPILMSAIAGIDQALWDIKGKHYDAPVYELLGGKARDRVQLYQHVHGDTQDEVVAAVEEAVDDGFRVLKTSQIPALRRIDSPATVDRIADTFGAMRRAAGDEVSIGIDFHGRVAKSMAPRLAAALEPHDPMFYEEPVLAQHNEALADLASHTSIPIATGERMFSRWDFKQVFEDGSVDLIQPDLSHAGGITEVHKIASMAEAYDVGLAPHCPLGPVALAACLQVDACAPNALVQEQIVHLSDREHDWVANPEIFDYEDGGYVSLPGGPGLGIEIDEEAVEGIDRDGWSVPQWRHEDGSVAEW